MRKTKLAVCAAVLGLVAAGLAAPAYAVVPPPSDGRAIPGPIYGVTIDDLNNATVANIITQQATLPYQPTTRVYFDRNQNPSYYAGTVPQLRAGSYIMGELLDSSDFNSISVSAYTTKVNAYLDQIGGNVDLWEVGNEVNGNWLGSYTSVQSKITAAFDAVEGRGGKTALTLYENTFAPNNCGDGTGELTPVQFTNQYVPARMKTGLEYVLLSFYPDNCQGAMPSASVVATEVANVHALYPNAKIGFAEIGTPSPVTTATYDHAKTIMNWAYGMTGQNTSYYIGGNFWWNAQEDAYQSPRLMLNDLKAAFTLEHNALTAASPSPTPTPTPTPTPSPTPTTC